MVEASTRLLNRLVGSPSVVKPASSPWNSGKQRRLGLLARRSNRCGGFLDLVLEEELALREDRRFRHTLRISKTAAPQDPGRLLHHCAVVPIKGPSHRRLKNRLTAIDSEAGGP
jgi:hypothetical protein